MFGISGIKPPWSQGQYDGRLVEHNCLAHGMLPPSQSFLIPIWVSAASHQVIPMHPPTAVRGNDQRRPRGSSTAEMYSPMPSSLLHLDWFGRMFFPAQDGSRGIDLRH